MTDKTLRRLFESSRLPASRFNHENHVRLAWIYLRADDLETATQLFCRDLRAYAASLNVPDKYHETITRFFLDAIHTRLADTETCDWGTFKDDNPDLVVDAPTLLRKHYSDTTIRSPEARVKYVPPDKNPIPSASDLKASPDGA